MDEPFGDVKQMSQVPVGGEMGQEKVCTVDPFGQVHGSGSSTMHLSQLSPSQSALVQRRHRRVPHSRSPSQLFYSIEIFFNRQRRHSTLGSIAPAEFEEMAEATA